MKKQKKTCFLIKMSQISDSGSLRQKVRRCLELSGHSYLKRVVFLYNPDGYELICHKMKLDEAVDIVQNMSYFVPESYCELKEL